ncbi:uncharacterized protein CG45076-like [Impatiens glandulifera]|uniref:uncharacterized protein CG45076-like n=1 Tax=Impatiens glandulifera TaxID=253017 RepID=UPI001FB0E289|nr:uncharacterized protein CG45076-like [Impatiens glandulifera]
MHEDSPVQGDNETQTVPQTEIIPKAEDPISEEEEEEMFQKLIQDMNREAEDLDTSYHLWVRLRCETKLSDMIPDFSGNEYSEKLVALEVEALKVTGTDVIQATYAKTMVMEEYAKLQAVTDAMKKAEGAILTSIELRMLKRFMKVQNDLTQKVDQLEAEWKEECKTVLTHVDQFRSKPIFNTGESSKTAENRSNDKIATVEANLTETVRASIHSEIAEAAQTSIKSMIAETVQTSIKSMIAKSIRADAETARRLQDEDEQRERLRKEIEDRDHELAKQYDDKEKAAQPESSSAQGSHSMKTRNKNKRKAVLTLLKQVERSGLEEFQPVGQYEQPLDEEEEEDAAQLKSAKEESS